MFCHRGHFSSASFTRGRDSGMDRPIIFSLKRSKWVCRIVLTSPRKQGSSDLTAVAARKLSVWKQDGLWLIGTRFRLTRHCSPNTNSAAAPFDTKKFRLLLEEERRKRKRADRPRFPMPTKFVCSWHRSSSGASNGP